MGIARRPSSITLPPANGQRPSILEFLVATFPHVPAERWRERLRDGKLRDAAGQAIREHTPYRAGERIQYFREVDVEPVVPFAECILFQNDDILVADKPHFLPVVPGGRYVNECLQQRLRDRTGIGHLLPVHRIDRETAGLVLFSVNPRTRGHYHALFARGEIDKTYEALARVDEPPATNRWRVANRLVRGEPRFRMTVVPGEVNARSEIELLARQEGRGRFRLRPLTGKTHQLRVHMSGLGFPILNDRYYPVLEAEQADDYTRPLRLLAAGLRFRDPRTGSDLQFRSNQTLPWPFQASP